MDLSHLKDLIPILAAAKVKSFKFEGLEVLFEADLGTKTVQNVQFPGVQTVPLGKPWSPYDFIPGQGIKTEKIEDVVVPQSVDEEMDFDKVLHWSGSGDDRSVKLTDDVPLSDEVRAEEMEKQAVKEAEAPRG